MKKLGIEKQIGLNCSIAIIKKVLGIDEMQAEIFSKSKSDTVPLLTGVKTETAKIYAKAFFDAGCIAVLK